MHEIIKRLPHQLKEIYLSVRSHERFGEPLDGIINWEFRSLAEIYEFLEQPDPLADLIYGGQSSTGDAKAADNTEQLAQASPGHNSLGRQETLKQHAAMVVGNLVDDLEMDPMMAAMLGVLHDCGKKYVRGADADDICFPGHEAVSAYLAGAWMDRLLQLEDNDLKLLIALVYAHEMPQAEWVEFPRQRGKFYAMLDGFFTGKPPAETADEPPTEEDSESPAGVAIRPPAETNVFAILVDQLSAANASRPASAEARLARIAFGEQIIAKYV